MIKRLLPLWGLSFGIFLLGSPPAFAARIAAMGCELGSAAPDISEMFLNGTGTACSTVAKRSGTYALRSNITVSATADNPVVFWSSTAGTIARTDAGATGGDVVSNAYASGYIRVTTLPSAAVDIVQFSISGGETRVCGLNLGTTGAITAVQADGTSVGAGPTIGTGEWWFVNLRCSVSATVGVITLQMAPAGSTTTRRPVQYVNVSNANTGTTNFDELNFGATSASVTMDVYYDDWRVDTAAYPGPGRVALLQSTGNGTYTAWTNDCTTVDEIPPTVTTADSITEATAADVESCTSVDLVTAPDNGESITTLWLFVARDRSAGTGSPTIQIRLRDNAADRDSTTSAAITGTDGVQVTQWATDNGGAAWADSDVDGAELGVELVAASSSTVRAFWIHGLVDVSQTARSGAVLVE